VGAVRCSKHGTNVAGPFCCDHVRKAVYAMATIPYAIYRVDVLDDGDMIVGNMVCEECASKFGLSVDVVVSGEVWGENDRYPYVCPECAQCFKDWSAQG
jgi:hypothetical protein